MASVHFKTIDIEFYFKVSKIRISSSFSRKFYVSLIFMFKNCYLVCIGGQIDKFDANIIAMIRNCQRTKPKRQIVIKTVRYFHLIPCGTFSNAFIKLSLKSLLWIVSSKENK